jgi:hypothetical protein
MARARLSQGQAMNTGPSSADYFGKPELLEAGLKPGLSGQAGPEQHYLGWSIR